MKFDKLEDESLVTILPHGRIDSNTSDAFAELLRNNLNEDKDLTIDFREVEYISSSGLRVLLTLQKEFGKNHRIVLTHVNNTVYDIFDITGFNTLFTIERDTMESLDIKALFFDVDGTLLSHQLMAIPESTKIALKKAQEKGVKVVIATGRDIDELKKLPLDGIHFDAYLTLNGNICRNADETMFAGNEIDPNEVEVLVNIFKAGKIPFVLVAEENRYINYVDDVVVETQLSTQGTIPDIGEYHGEKIYQCISFVDYEMRQKLERLLDHCHITSWNRMGIDIIAKTGGKDAGIQKFLDKEGISRSQTMAFGDGENDIGMLQFVSIGVAMGNGSDFVKQKADFVTASVDEDGIAKALIYFGIIDDFLAKGIS